jgi:hypothetical protein
MTTNEDPQTKLFRVLLEFEVLVTDEQAVADANLWFHADDSGIYPAGDIEQEAGRVLQTAVWDKLKEGTSGVKIHTGGFLIRKRNEQGVYPEMILPEM